MIRGAILAALLALAGPARAEPALFAVKGGRAPMALFGSIHVLRPGEDWHTPALRQAFEAAQRCVFESDVEGAGLGELVQLLPAIDLFHRISADLDAEERFQFMLKVEKLIPGALPLLDRTAPWFAAMVLLAAEIGDGMTGTVEAGVDATLTREALEAGKDLGVLEGVRDLVGVFGRIPRAAQLDMLRSTIRSDGMAAGEQDALEAAWRAGDLGRIGATLDGMKAGSPVLMDALVQGRNAMWMERLLGMLEGDEAVLVTVGAGHLVGPGNLRELLEARGYTIVRLQ